MTPNGTPDDERGDDLPEQGSPDPHLPGPPPPPWLAEAYDDKGDPGSTGEASSGEPAADETIGVGGEPQTQVFTQDSQQPAPPAPPSVPAAPPGTSAADYTMTDFSRGTPSGGPGGDDENDRTRVVPNPGPATPAAPAPPPFPWAQEIPGSPPPADSPQPSQPQFPAAAAQPPAPQPPAPQPPAPLPAPPPPAAPSQSPPAHEPFPWAQEIPDSPRAPAPEPFPWAQEIPGQSPPQASAQAQAPAPQPFPYAQDVPGPGQPASGNPMSASPPPAVSPAPAVPPLPVDEPWRSPVSPRRKGLNKKLLFGVIGGVAAIALAAGGAVVLLGGGDGDVEGGGSAKLAGKLFTADPAARSDGRDQELTGVAASGSTVVAVGGEADPGNYRGVFLVSTDGGRTFKAAEVKGQDGGAPGNAEVPHAVAGGQGGWVAIGTRPGGGAVWTSEDGRSWQRRPDAAGEGFGPNTRVSQAIRTDKGFLAIGEHSRKGDFSDSVPAAWLSADGRSWDALVGTQVGIPLRGRVVLEGAAATGGVVLMESAHAPEPGKSSFRRAWRSTDGGRTWSPAKIPAPKGTQGLKVGGGPAGLVAVREVKSGKATYGQVFTSTDATRWKTGGKLRQSGYQHVHQLLATDSGFAAIVQRSRDLLVTRSADGGTWQDAGTLPLASGRALLGASTVAGQTTVLVGREPGNGDLNALLTVRGANGAEIPVDPLKISGAFRDDQAVHALAAAGAQAVAVGSTGGDAAIWNSADGSAWNRARFSSGVSRQGLQRLYAVAQGGSGWLAVGEGGGSPRRPLVLASADGATWNPADTDPVFQPKGSQPLATYGAAAGPAGYVVVGEDGESGSIWFSPDLKTWQRGGGVGRNDLTAEKNGNRWVRSAAGGAFGFVAVGGMQNPAAPGPGRPAVWTSPDGKKWKLQELKLPAGVSQGWFTHVAAKGNVLVAAGEGTDQSGTKGFAFVSSDGGKTWSESSPPAPGSEGPVRMTAVTATPQGFVIAGATGPTGAANVVAWTSADGKSWEATTPGGDVLSGAGRQEITGLASFKDTLLGVGRTVSPSSEEPLLWTRPAE